jgi:anti-sigma regulatory factor (Ser/Thr protein kinase)
METPPGASRHRGPSANPRATVLGSLTIEGHPRQVAVTRAFVSRTLSASHLKVDSDAATLLTSEIVTNAIQHTKSGVEGTVTIVIISVPRGVLIEVIDDGSAEVPIVKGDLYAAEGHGLFLVQQLAAQWGYVRDPAGTTVWFHLPSPAGQDLIAEALVPGTGRTPADARDGDRADRYYPRPDLRGSLASPSRFRVPAFLD